MEAIAQVDQPQQSPKRGNKKRRASQKVRIIVGAAVVVVIAAAITVFLFLGQAGAQEAPITNQATVTTENFSTTIEGTGSLTSAGTSNVDVSLDLEIEHVSVEVGDSVSEGDALASVDPISVSIELRTAQERLDELAYEINYTRKDTAEYYTLLKEQQDLNDEVNALSSIAQDNTIKATKAGIVNEIKVKEGMSVGAAVKQGTGSNGGTDSSAASTNNAGLATAFKIASGTDMTLSIEIDERDILSVEIGQKVEVTLDAVRGETFEGTVSRIDTNGTSNKGVTKYSVGVTLPKTEQMLAGMNASAAIITEELPDTLAIPQAALQAGETGLFVYTTYNENTGELGGRVDVSPGKAKGTMVEITSGLAEGDTVYYQTAPETDSGEVIQLPGGGSIKPMPGGGALASVPEGTEQPAETPNFGGM